ncbi:MAG: hypothetical protein ACREIC_31180 [Limisphaerales bacterium]
MKKARSNLRGRTPGIPQPTGPEKIKRDETVIWDSLLRRARAGEAEAVRLCKDLGLIDPSKMRATRVA